MRLPVCVVSLALGACAATQAPPPVTSLAGRACASQMDLSPAHVLPAPQGTRASTLEFDIGADASCVAQAGEPGRVYVVVQLPEMAEPYIMDVISMAQGEATFSPRLRVLNAAGHVVSEKPRSGFRHRGTSLRAGMQMQPAYRTLVIESDTEGLGQGTDHIVPRTDMYAVPVGPVVLFTRHGREDAVQTRNALNGRMRILARYFPAR